MNPIGIVAHDNADHHLSRFDADKFIWQTAGQHKAQRVRKLLAYPNNEHPKMIYLIEEKGKIFQFKPGALSINQEGLAPTYSDGTGVTTMAVNDAEIVPAIGDVLKPHLVAVGTLSAAPQGNAGASRSGIAFLPIDASTGELNGISGQQGEGRFFISGDANGTWLAVAFQHVDVGNDHDLKNDEFNYFILAVDGLGVGTVGWLQLPYSELVGSASNNPFGFAGNNKASPPFRTLPLNLSNSPYMNWAITFGVINGTPAAVDMLPWTAPDGTPEIVVGFVHVHPGTPPAWFGEIAVINAANKMLVQNEHVSDGITTQHDIMRIAIADQTVASVTTHVGANRSTLAVARLPGLDGLTGFDLSRLNLGHALAWGFRGADKRRPLYVGGYKGTSRAWVWMMDTMEPPTLARRGPTISFLAPQEANTLNPPLRDDLAAIVIIDDTTKSPFGMKNNTSAAEGGSGEGHKEKSLCGLLGIEPILMLGLLAVLRRRNAKNLRGSMKLRP